MKVDVTDLLSVEDKAFEQKVETELTSFQSKLGEFPIIRKAPFVLHLENHKKRYIKVTGTTDVVVVVPCDRCLKEVQDAILAALQELFGSDFIFSVGFSTVTSQ